MVLLDVIRRSQQTAWGLLHHLDVTKEQRHELLREARRRAKQKGRIGGSSVVFNLVCAFVALFTTGFVGSILERLFAGVPYAVPAGVLLYLGGYILFASRLYRIWEFPGMRGEMAQLLHERGRPFCRNCLYDLRGIAGAVEHCPECSVYITERAPGEHEETPVLFAPGRRQRDAESVLIGGDVPAKVLEHAIIRARRASSAEERRMNRALSVIAGLTIAIGYGLLILGGVIFGDVSKSLWIPLLGLVLIVVIGLPAWVGMRQRTRYLQRARRELRRAGYAVCEHCGQSLGEADAAHTACPRCGSQCKPLSTRSAHI